MDGSDSEEEEEDSDDSEAAFTVSHHKHATSHHPTHV